MQAMQVRVVAARRTDSRLTWLGAGPAASRAAASSSRAQADRVGRAIVVVVNVWDVSVLCVCARVIYCCGQTRGGRVGSRTTPRKRRSAAQVGLRIALVHRPDARFARSARSPGPAPKAVLGAVRKDGPHALPVGARSMHAWHTAEMSRACGLGQRHATHARFGRTGVPAACGAGQPLVCLPGVTTVLAVTMHGRDEGEAHDPVATVLGRSGVSCL
jgi:hypothetical protein